jgi:GDP-L-fucose synthase
MNKQDKIYVAGHTGLVGSSIVRKLQQEGYTNLVMRTHEELDLRCQEKVVAFFEEEKPDYVFVAAAVVGGVYINSICPGEFMYDNLMISTNVIHSAYLAGVKKLLYMGSGCIYPKFAEQPITEEALLTGELEKTNEGYAIAKIAGVKLCEYYNKQYKTDFISVMPCNAYGPGDHFGLEDSHVVPAMIRKFHDGKVQNKEFVELWGTGTPIREFIYIDDIGDACVYYMNHPSEQPWVNIGTGKEFMIRDLADTIKEVVGYQGEIRYDVTKPDGTPRKLLDSTKMQASGWNPKVAFDEGIQKTYEYFLNVVVPGEESEEA